jgi:beta-lactamase regulating signal transducer with metallopeptidase domain
MDFANYILVSAACLGISYILFRLFMRNEILLLQQRIFLMASIILSLTLPLTRIAFRFPARPATASLPGDLADASAYVPQVPFITNHFNPVIYLYYMYVTVTAILALLIIVQLFRVTLLYMVSDKTIHGDIVILRSERIKSPFSFFRWVFIPAAVDDKEEIRSICTHEGIHAAQYHSLDNLILETACVLMWFNPVIWMMKRSVHLIHEYLADEGTLSSGIEKLRYQALLVNQAAGGELVSIPSGFYNNLLKKRIIMMAKTKIKETYRVKIFSIMPLPLIILLTVSVLNGFFPADGNAQEKEESKNAEKKELTVAGNSNPSKKDSTASKGDNEKTKKSGLKEIKAAGYAKPAKIDSTANISDREIMINSTGKQDDTLNYIVDGVKAGKIGNMNPDSVVLKKDLGIITMTKRFQYGKVNSININNVNFRPDYGNGNRIFYIRDGINIPESEITNIPVESIERIDVMKSEAAREKYGAKGYDGVIIITTKKK